MTEPVVYQNLPVPRLVEEAIRRGEAVLTPAGALNATTGRYTGRSPKDKFIVDEPAVHDHIAWGSVNQPFSVERFDRLLERVKQYLAGRDSFVLDAFAGADPAHRLHVRLHNELAWHNLFVRQLFIRPQPGQALGEPDFTVYAAPGFYADPARDGTHSETFIITSFSKRTIIIGGSGYAGEMKKSIFGVLNYLLPARNTVPMHCSANIGKGGDVALFFGLSGTGKTTLSSDPDRHLIGDDEHGWSEQGVFNFEGGCYAKCIKLKQEHEPLIWDAIRFGAVLENVVVDPETRAVDYDSDALTENSRAAYPIEYIPDAVYSGVGGHPTNIFFLTADGTGVLPPISRLEGPQAMYYFLSGYTSKLAGTERGVSGVEATFSTCFGAPFLPRPPLTYAKMLDEKVREHKTRVFLINTGWTGGPHGVGERIRLAFTRAMIGAALDGRLDQVEYRTDPIFRVRVPLTCPNVPYEILDPRNTWADKAAYDEAARKLARSFVENFKVFGPSTEAVGTAGPRVE